MINIIIILHLGRKEKWKNISDIRVGSEWKVFVGPGFEKVNDCRAQNLVKKEARRKFQSLQVIGMKYQIGTRRNESYKFKSLVKWRK